VPRACVVPENKGPERDAPALPNGRLVVPCRYFSAVETVLNVLLNCVPRPWITAMIATEILAASNAYSIAVAAVSGGMLPGNYCTALLLITAGKLVTTGVSWTNSGHHKMRPSCPVMTQAV
jgi:hypothetical protein